MKLKLKKILVIIFIVILIFFNASNVFANSEKPDIISQAAILIDNKTGKVLYQKNQDKIMFPASTTKILTSILALENCALNEVVTVSYDTVMSIPEGYSTAYLQIGEQLTVEQLLQLTLVHSANDAANALAEYVGGSFESFVSMMNTKVNELGLVNTHFTNAFGMHDDNHYTTAEDLATIMRYCIKNDDFRRLAGSASCSIPATNKYGTRQYTSTNELIIPTSNNYYPYMTCGKTGYTSQAGDCLVSCSYKDNLELICVVLGGETVNGISTKFSETKTLYEYGYNNYSLQNLLNKNDVITQIEIPNGTSDTKNLDLIANSSINVLLENTILNENLNLEINLKNDIKAPVEQGDCLGTASYTIDGVKYETDLIASHYVENSKLLSFIIEIGICILIVVTFITYLLKKRKKNI